MTHEFQERREGYARISQEEITAINHHITQEDAVIKSLKFSLSIMTKLIAALIALTTWIALTIISDIKAQGILTNQLAVQGGQTLAVLQNKMESDKREFDRINRLLEK